MPKRKAVAATDVRILSMDLGNAYSSLRADGGITADWRSVIGQVSGSNRIADLPFDSVIQIGPHWYAFGEEARTVAANSIEDFPTKDRYTSAWYKRLFAFALHKAYGLRLSEGPFCPKIVTSVPASEFKIAKRVDAIKKNLTGNYVIQTTKGTALQVIVDPSSLTVIPEGIGSFYTMLNAGDRGGGSVYAAGTWIVLDLGYLTGDIVMLTDGNYISDRAASDDTIGVRKISEAVADFVRGEGGPDLDASTYDAQIRCDTIRVGGQSFDIRGVRETASAQVGERIGRFLQKSASGQNVAGVILSGGGAEYLRSYIKTVYPLVDAINPRRANVEGGYSMIAEGE